MNKSGADPRRADETAALVRRWSGSPIVAATFEEVPVEDEEPLRRATEEVIGTALSRSVHLTGVGTNRWFGLADYVAARTAGLGAHAFESVRMEMREVSLRYFRLGRSGAWR